MGRAGLESHDLVANVILTQRGEVSLPAPPHEGDAPMADAPDFPRIFYHPTEPSRIFESQEELTAAGGPWFKTPTEAADAAAKATEPAPPPAPEAEDEPHTPRSRR